MKPFLLTLTVALGSAACSTGPVIMRPDGTKIMLTASLLEKSTEESAVVKMPDGTEIAYMKRGKDQTMLAREAVRAWASVAGITATAEGLNGGEAIREKGMTARAVSADSVKKADIAGEVKKTTTLVPPAFRPASSF